MIEKIKDRIKHIDVDKLNPIELLYLFELIKKMQKHDKTCTLPSVPTLAPEDYCD